MERITKNFYLSIGFLTVALALLPRFYKYYIVLGPVLLMLAIYNYIHNGRSKYGLIFISLATGLNILFRFDFGVYSFLTCVLAIIIVGREIELIELFKKILKFTFIVIAMVLPWAIFVVFKTGSFKNFIDLLSILKGIGVGLSLPVPGFNLSESFLSGYNNFSLLFWMFRLLPILALALLFFFRNEIEKKEKNFIFVTSIFCILVFIQALHRTSISHLLQVIPVFFILLAWIFRSVISYRKSYQKLLKVMLSFYFIVFIIGWTGFIDKNRIVGKYNRNLKHGISDYKDFFSPIKKLRGKFTRNKNIRIANLVNEYTEIGEPVFFTPIEPQLYYFSERLFKVPIGVLGPGRLRDEKEQLKFFEDLIDSGTKVIVDRPFFRYDKIKERNPRFYYPLLMKLIYSNFRICGRIEDSIVLCNDNRFADKLTGSRYRFTLCSLRRNKKTIYDITFKINSINTFLKENYISNVSRESFLFVNGKLIFDLKKYKKDFLFFGLAGDSDIYISKFKLKKKLVRKLFLIDLFSSMKSVKPGLYELAILYIYEGNIAVKNVNIYFNIF